MRAPPSGSTLRLRAVAGFGPLQRLLDDPEIEELWSNERRARALFEDECTCVDPVDGRLSSR